MNSVVDNTASLASRWAKLPEEEHHRLISCFASAEDRASGRRDSLRDDTLCEVEDMTYQGNAPAIIARQMQIAPELVQAYVDAANALMDAVRANQAEDEVELRAF